MKFDRLEIEKVNSTGKEKCKYCFKKFKLSEEIMSVLTSKQIDNSFYFQKRFWCLKCFEKDKSEELKELKKLAMIDKL